MPQTPPAAIVERLNRFGQQHLLKWWAELGESERASLLGQIAAIDFDQLARLCRDDASNPAESPAERARRAQPPRDLVRLPQSAEQSDEWRRAAERGRQVLAAGKVGCVLVAGGQGTRLGFDHPKGMFGIGPASGNSLFQILAEQVLARAQRARVRIPLYVMTSDATHDETVAFFDRHRSFGLDPADLYFFRQGNMPAVDLQSGRVLMCSKSSLATSPDGHGGILAAMGRAGLLDDIRGRGIDYLFYFQVDNPTVKVADPAFIGWHVLRGSEMTTKVVAKTSATERMGCLVDVEGRTEIIEYSDLPEDVARQTDRHGSLRFWAGSTAIHLFNRTFIERLVEGDLQLPFHVAKKHVPYLDETGRQITPESGRDPVNARKFERFIFDALPHAAPALVVEADRAREFNPVKNREGADSPETARQAMIAIAHCWFKQAGMPLPPSAIAEISPLYALDEDEFAAKLSAGEGPPRIYLS